MRRLIFPVFMLIFLLSACSARYVPNVPSPTIDPALTLVAQTAQAQQTEQAILALSATATATATATQTPTPRATNTPLLTHTPTTTPTPSNPPTPTITPIGFKASPTITRTPTVTNTFIPRPCLRAEFLEDVTIPDGTRFAPGDKFTKTWRVRNTGSCTWNGAYSMVLVKGDSLSATDPATTFYRQVAPGEEISLSLNMIAPNEGGDYAGYWRLVDPDQKVFGIGADGQGYLWVKIRVNAKDPDYNYDMVANACKAEWTNPNGAVPCPSEDSKLGIVKSLTRPELENGRTENEPTLQTSPTAGWLRGFYPAYKVRPNDYLVADVGCLAGNDQCDITFIVQYQDEKGVLREFETWREVYDGNLTNIKISLADLQGQEIRFVLRVQNNGESKNANGFWLGVGIRQYYP